MIGDESHLDNLTGDGLPGNPFFRGGPDRGQPNLVLTTFQLFSALVLTQLRLGPLRVPRRQFEAAKVLIRRGPGWRWGLIVDQTEPDLISFKLDPGNDSEVKAELHWNPMTGRVDLGDPDLSPTGRDETDIHIAIILTQVWRNVLVVPRADFIRAGDDVLRDHRWAVRVDDPLDHDEQLVLGIEE